MSYYLCWGSIALQIFATVTVDEFAPGAKSIFSFTIPDHKSGKVPQRSPLEQHAIDIVYSSNWV